MLIDPVVEFANAKQREGLGVTVTDGFMYRSTALSDLQEHLVFSMWSRSQAEPRGRLFYAIPADTGLWQIGELTPGQPVAGTVGHFILGMGQTLQANFILLPVTRGRPSARPAGCTS